MKRAAARAIGVGGLFAILLLISGPGWVGAQTFPQQDITLINPFAGGNFESQSRLFAPIFQSKLPKNVKVIVQNVPGGAGIIGYNKAIEAPADGYTLSIDDPIGNGLRKIDQGDRAKFDPTAWAWLGGWFSDFPALGVRASYPASDWTSFVEAGKSGRISFATPGKGTLNHGQQQLLAKVFGLNVKFVHYQSTAQVRTALARGEVDAYIAPASTIGTWVDANEMKWIAILRDGKDPQRPHVATLDNLGAVQQQKDQILALAGGARGWMTNKKVPAERVKVLRDAFWAAANEPAWLEALKKVGIIASPIKGEDMQAFAESVWPTFPAQWSSYMNE
jgi:tripartite-type tricarboxylate transporter receptor subunit TctC